MPAPSMADFPPSPQSPDMSNKVKEGTWQPNPDKDKIWSEWYLQSRKTITWDVQKDIKEERRSFTNEGPQLENGERLPPGTYCRYKRDIEHYSRSYALYYMKAFKLEKETSWLEVAGWVAVGVGFVALVVLTGGLALGAGFVVVGGGSAFVAGAVITAGAKFTAVLAAGIIAGGAAGVANAEDGESKGKPIAGADGYIWSPEGEATVTTDSAVIVRDWGPCN